MTAKTPLLLLSAALALSACSKQQTPAATGQSASLSKDVVATYPGGQITLGEVDVSLGDELYTLRRNQLEQMLNTRLVKDAAAKKGVPVDQLYKEEVASKVAPPPDAEIQRFYDENQARLRGAPFDMVKPQIAQHLQQQQMQRRMQEFHERLRKEVGATLAFDKTRVPVPADGPSRGPDGAKVTLVAFSDFQCPYCSTARQEVDQVMGQYAGKVKLVFKQYPLNFHKEAHKAAQAALCANDQGRFWDYHDKLFENQRALGVEQLKTYGKDLGLDEGKFVSCLDGNTHAAKVDADLAQGEQVGVRGTPTFFVNGMQASTGEIRGLVEKELAN